MVNKAKTDLAVLGSTDVGIGGKEGFLFLSKNASRRGLQIPVGTKIAECIEVGRTLIDISDWDNWAQGDFINAGLELFGDEFNQVLASVFGTDDDTAKRIRELKHICSVYPPGDRTYNLSFTHYRLLAGRDPKFRDKVLQWASDHGSSTTDVRKYLAQIDADVSKATAQATTHIPSSTPSESTEQDDSTNEDGEYQESATVAYEKVMLVDEAEKLKSATTESDTQQASDWDTVKAAPESYEHSETSVQQVVLDGSGVPDEPYTITEITVQAAVAFITSRYTSYQVEEIIYALEQWRKFDTDMVPNSHPGEVVVLQGKFLDPADLEEKTILEVEPIVKPTKSKKKSKPVEIEAQVVDVEVSDFPTRSIDQKIETEIEEHDTASYADMTSFLDAPVVGEVD